MANIEMEFRDALACSIDKKSSDFEKRNDDKLYYKEKYKDILDSKIKTISPKAHVNKDINAVASSARLCTLDFFDCAGLEFEKKLTNDIGVNSYLDVVIGNTFYECKCQEIVRKNKGKLSVRYRDDSDLLKELMGEDALKDCEGEESFTVPVKPLGIDLEESLHFDLKQLLCHLIAIANTKNSPYRKMVLQYVFYKPSEEVIESKTELKKLYLKLENEIAEIWRKGNRIADFCESHNITLASPIFKNVNLIDDFVLREMRESN